MMGLLAGCVFDVEIGQECLPVVINEVMTQNNTDVLDPDIRGDWFELHNTGEEDADLTGYTLRGNQEREKPYVLPAGPDSFIAAGDHKAYLAITYSDPSVEVPHTGHIDFNNDADGLRLYLSESLDAYECDGVEIPDTHEDVSWQRDPSDPELWCDSGESTPAAPNVACMCEEPYDEHC